MIAFILAGELESADLTRGPLRHTWSCLKRNHSISKPLSGWQNSIPAGANLTRPFIYVRQVLKVDTYAPGANFIYANLQKLKGNLTDAKDGFRWAMRSLEYHSASLQLLSEISLMEGKPELAHNLAEKSLIYNSLNLNSYKIQAIAQRKLNNHKQAEKILTEILEIDPLDHFALFERYLLNPGKGGWYLQ